MLRGMPTRSDVSITPAPTNTSKTRTEVNVNPHYCSVIDFALPGLTFVIETFRSDDGFDDEF